MKYTVSDGAFDDRDWMPLPANDFEEKLRGKNIVHMETVYNDVRDRWVCGILLFTLEKSGRITVYELRADDEAEQPNNSTDARMGHLSLLATQLPMRLPVRGRGMMRHDMATKNSP